MKRGIQDLQITPGVKKVAFTGVLGALALALSAMEALLPPLPVLPPGAKPGFSNLTTMYAAYSVGVAPALCVALLKGLFAGLTRGWTALLMSLAGGIASTLVMAVFLRHSGPFGLVGVGVAGALTHNLAQLGVAAALTTPAVAAYLPWLLIFGAITGTATGFLLKLALPLLDKLGSKLDPSP